MSIKKIVLLSFLCLCVLISGYFPATTVSAEVQTTYYVSPTGSDSNPGTLSQPFLTIAKARDVVRTVNSNMTGDIVVYLRGGEYTLTQTLEFNHLDSGTNGYNIIYQKYPGEIPVISGGQHITGWELYDGTKNIYRAAVPNGFDTRQLYVNGLRATRALGSSMLGGFSDLKSQGLTSYGYGSDAIAQNVIVDLGSSQSISAVELYPFTGSESVSGGNPGFPVDFTIETATDGVNYYTVKTVVGQGNPDNVGQSYTFTPTSARYIKINVTKLGEPQSTEPGVYRLQLSEIKAFASENLALGKTVTSNNSLEAAPSWTVSNLTDGDTSTSYTSYSSSSHALAAYVQVDLGSSRSVSQVKLYPRPYWTLGGGSPGFPTNYTIEASADGANYTTVKTVTGLENPYGVPQEYTFTPTNARYIKVNVTEVGDPAYGDEGVYRFQISEVQIQTTGNLAKGKTVTASSSVENAFLGVAKLTDGFDDSNTIGIYDSNSTMVNWKNPGDIEVVLQRFGWQQERCGVESISGNEIIMQRPCWLYTPVPAVISYALAYKWVENAYELLDFDGEWYLDKTGAVDGGVTPYIYYRPRYGEDVATSAFITPNVEKLITGKGTLDNTIHNIQFIGLSFQHSTWLVPNSNDGYADNQAGTHIRGLLFSSQQVARVPAAVSFHAARNITLQGNLFTRLSGAGLSFEYGSQDNLIAANKFSDISAGGISLGDVRDHHPADNRAIVLNNTIENNYITRTGVEYYDTVGIWAGYTQETLIRHNEIYNLPYTGISVGWGWGYYDAGGTEGYVTPTVSHHNAIEYNLVHYVLQELQDGGGIYLQGEQAGTTVTNNYINQVSAISLGNTGGALYPDQGSRYINMNHNVINDAYKWLSMWTTSIQDNLAQYNYSNTSNYLDAGISNTVNNNTTVTGAWPSEAQTIIDNAGIESAYQSVKVLGVDTNANLAAEQLVTSSNSYEIPGWSVVRLTDGAEDGCYTSTSYGSDINTVNVTVNLNTSRTVGSVILYPRVVDSSGGSPNYPVDFTIQYSTDGINFNTAQTLTGHVNPQGKAQEYAFAPVTAKFIKINATRLGTPAVGETGNYRLQLSEIKVNSEGNYAWGKTSSATNSVEFGAWGLAKLTDGQSGYRDLNAGYSSNGYGSQNNTVFITTDLGSTKPVCKVKLYPRGDGAVAVGGGSPNYPVDFTIQVSTDGVNYSTVKTVTNEPNPDGLMQEYTFDAVNARYVKVNVTKLGSPPTGEPTLYRLQISEMKVY